MKQKLLNILVYGLLIISLIIICVCIRQSRSSEKVYNDGIEQIDLNTIKLNSSKVTVDFANILMSPQREARKLIVSDQDGTAIIKITKKTFEWLDLDINEKTQEISYVGKANFVVDLDKLTKDSFIDDKDKKELTILIDHAYLDTIEIDPNKIMIGKVKKKLLARGDIKLTVNDYNEIEKQIRNRLKEQFNTAANA